ncbi:MAG: penicillin-binding protein activator LpoB [Deltaproteobacteria bacterium]|nr:penicillin-binding protein activator LpoB [Deltaproteobacteria bacterium]
MNSRTIARSCTSEPRNVDGASRVSLVLAFGVFAGTACATATVNRTDPRSTVGGDLSGYWNDIDANSVAEAMIRDCLSNPWASDYQAKNGGKKPAVKLMPGIKRTDDRQINEEYFTRRVERELLNSGQVMIVAGWTEQDVNVSERRRQAVDASDETAKGQGNETGADFALQTVINSQNEVDGGGRSVRAYLVNMFLVHVESNEKVWMGEKQLRKTVQRPRIGL